MARLLALEWDQREARLVAAQRKGSALAVQQALAIPLTNANDGAPLPSHQVAERIAKALAQAGIARGDVLLAVGRANLELRLLNLPPAPPDELPQLVRFQALREFHSLEEDWLLDYVSLDERAQQQTVLAAAISPEVAAQITATCAAAGLNAERMALRPGAAAALLKRVLTDPDKHPPVRLLLDVLADEADLSVLVGDHLIFTRTARLPATEATDERVAVLVAEARRTMIAAQNQQPGGKAQAIYVCGATTEDVALAEALSARLRLPAHTVNPFDFVTLEGEARRHLPDRPGRFAPLIGLLLDEAAELRPDIDFLQPRRMEKQRAASRPLMLAGALAGCVVLAVASWLWFGLASLDDEIEEMKRKLSQLDKQTKTSAAIQKEVGQIDEWAAADVMWLAELDYLSQRFPIAADAQLLRLRLLPGKDGGRMELDGAARAAETLDMAEQNLRDARHTVVGQGSHQDEGGGRYRWRFAASVNVTPADPNAGPSAATQAPPSASTAQPAGDAK